LTVLRWVVVLLFIISGCGGKAFKTVTTPFPDQKASRIADSHSSSVLELIPGKNIPPLLDDLDKDSLLLAIERSLQYFNRFRDAELYYFGSLQCTVKAMKETLIAFRDIICGKEPDHVKEENIRAAFDFYKSAGDNGQGRVIFTGYYEPLLEGSFTKTEKYRYPLYRTPEETVVISGKDGAKNKDARLVGRMYQGEAVPHYTRRDIDGKGVLTGRNLEIIWVDDFIDLFFLHIQGSGKIRLADGRLIQVGFAQFNGYPFRSIGAYLADNGKLAKNNLSLQTIKKYLREHPEEASEILYYNDRYVFFRLMEQGPFGALNVPITGGRTIASDPNIFPKGALALIIARKPLINHGKVSSWMPFSRFVLNQDAGGAIIGAGRIDLFCGSGDDAGEVAGRLKEPGELFFLIKKSFSGWK
jgi:membrane-bound lytic murein transglycosylase A